VIGNNGTLIDAEAVNRIYHNLNLLNLQNRSYKLYHASAGLQKTSDQIDKLYDLGKDDVDQTFSGSDRPEHLQSWSNNEGVGNWQMSVEKEATNYCKESNDLGSIFGGNWTKTEGAGDSPFGDVNEAVEIDMNTGSTGASNYIELSVDTATNFSSGDYITVSFYTKKIAGSSGQPELLIEGEDSNNNPISLIQKTFSTQVGEYQFFEFTAQWSSDGTLRQAGCRIQDNDTSADTVYQFWGMQIERGQYATSRISTDGAIATRLASNPVLDNFLVDEGSVALWVNLVLSTQYRTLIFDNNDQYRFLLYYLNTGSNFRFYCFNDLTSSLNIVFPVTNNKIYRIGFVLSWSGNTSYLYMKEDGGSILSRSETKTINPNVKTANFGQGGAGDAQLVRSINMISSSRVIQTESEALEMLEAIKTW
jgi:hypothetical protein